MRFASGVRAEGRQLSLLGLIGHVRSWNDPEAMLVVTTSAVIERPGTYWAYAELWGGVDGNRPIAFARDSQVAAGHGAAGPQGIEHGGRRHPPQQQ